MNVFVLFSSLYYLSYVKYQEYTLQRDLTAPVESVAVLGLTSFCALYRTCQAFSLHLFFLFQFLLSKVARVFAAYRDFATGRLRVVPWVGRQVVLPVERVAQYGAAAVVDVACALPRLLLLPAVVPARGDTEVVSGRNHS